MEVCISNKISGNANAGAGTTLRASLPWFVTFLFCNRMVLGSPPPAEKPTPAISSSGTRVHSGPFSGVMKGIQEHQRTTWAPPSEIVSADRRWGLEICICNRYFR
ncbi:unnamed protein product [Rangifer tarandus platyrhynchus]|uniref:Uncharacterized protein n=2 Tax=Rangifer tarandus platyrhynchus TaxID=3082113 RepID=A0ABN8ZRX4_RANTA|nr:unnamed protein product [Rangifer tarandus platyrhynchus]